MIDQAIEVIRYIEAFDKKLRGINAELRVLYGDFYPTLPLMPDGLHTQVIKLLDEVLGDSLASYYLYDRPTKGGSITEKDGTEWPINTLADLRRYVLHCREAVA